MYIHVKKTPKTITIGINAILCSNNVNLGAILCTFQNKRLELLKEFDIQNSIFSMKHTTNDQTQFKDSLLSIQKLLCNKHI